AHFANAPSGVRDAARDAMQRRWTNMLADQLEVVRAPARRGRGRYRVAASAGDRSYGLLLRGTAPLDLVCECADFRSGGLGVCKHGLTLLRDLADDADAFERLARAPHRAPPVRWSPVWSATEPSDWVRGVALAPDAAVGARLRGLGAGPDGTLRVDPSRQTSQARSALVAHVAALNVGRAADPALAAWLGFEAEEQARAASLDTARRGRARALRRFGATLRPYQRRTVERFLARGRLLLADDMGLGKTVQAAAIAHVLLASGAAERVLVIAPASLKAQWCAEWARFVPSESGDVAPVVGGAKQRHALYGDTARGVLVANYEQVHLDLEAIARFAPQLVILDEGQRIKNWPTRTAQAVKRIHSSFRLVLTGTPIENRLDELMSILDWLDPYAIAPKWRLPAEHMGTDEGADGMRHLVALRARLAPICLRRTRAEVLGELPEREDRIHAVGVTERQQTAHDEVTPEIAKLLARSEKRPLTQREFLRLMMLFTIQRTVANGLGLHEFEQVFPEIRLRHPSESVLSSLHAPKLSYLRDLIVRIALESGQRVVVFSQWRRFLELAHWATAPALEAAGVRALFFSGNESQLQRARNVQRFHDDPDTRVLWCTDAGGVGLNLQHAAHVCVHAELPWNPAVFEQRVARIHRMGQPERVTVHTLYTPTTIEGRIAESLRTKRQLFAGVFDGDTDTLVFDERGGTLGALRAIYDDEVALALRGSSRDEVGDDTDDATADALEDVPVEAREDERGAARPVGDQPNGTTAASHSATTGATASLSALALSDMGALLSSLSVTTRADGGLRIEAPPETAGALAALFRGMASALEATAMQEQKGPNR
ncbi:MAG: DEAD/DEAH box helicase, partial [Myxococcales bacterium]|nr:DEAD/DEAH box helicase [Myxococcales bacterium]